MSIAGKIHVRSKNLNQILRVEAIDDLGDTTSVSINLGLRPGAYWQEVSGINLEFHPSEVAADGAFFYILNGENGVVYRTQTGNNLEEILNLNSQNSYTFLRSSLDGKVVFVEKTDEATTIYSSNDQGSTWQTTETNFIQIDEMFIIDGLLYCLEQVTNYIYRLDEDTWSLVVGSEAP